MNVKELLMRIKEFVEGLDELNGTEVLVVPSRYDPKLPQDEVSFIIMEEVGNKRGRIPRFKINVEDLEAIRKKKLK